MVKLLIDIAARGYPSRCAAGMLALLCTVPFGLGLSSVQTLHAQTAGFTSAQLEQFEREVRPLLAEQCSSCHSNSVGNTKGDLSLDTRAEVIAGGESGAAIVPGDPEASLLVEAIRRESFEMPPEKPLTAAQIESVVEWIKHGAPWPEQVGTSQEELANWQQRRTENHWAWHKAESVRIPPQEDSDDWSSGPIDRFILDRLQKEGLSPARLADDGVLLRRLSFDLVGLPPDQRLLALAEGGLTQAELQQAIDRLMASPQFGVKWGRHWLDLMRYAETLGHEFDYPIHYVHRYRDAVVDSLNDDVSYARFVTEHIAGDCLQTGRLQPVSGVDQSLALTGWWWLGDTVHAPVDITSDWATRVDNQIDVFSKAFLGMTLACARCHDHKFDAISQADYYSLAAVIESSRRTYAITDPHGAIAAHNHELQSELGKARAQVEALQARDTEPQQEEIIEWLDDLTGKLARQETEGTGQRAEAGSLLQVLKVLSEAQRNEQPEQPEQSRRVIKPEVRGESEERRPGKSLREALAELDRSVTRYDRWLAGSELYARFGDRLPAGWSLNGPQALLDADGSIDWFTSPYALPGREPVFSSARLGTQQFAILRSPNFEVSRPVICVKMRGKAAQSSVVASNYFMGEFHTLLFKDTYKDVTRSDDRNWVVHQGDLNKYIGHSAFLSFHDMAGGWFEIEEVRFADAPPPSSEPSWLVRQLLDRSVVDAVGLRAQLTDLMQQAFQQRDARAMRELISIGEELGAPCPLANRQTTEKLRVHLVQFADDVPEPLLLLATEEGTPRAGAIAIRGNPHQRGRSVTRGELSNLARADVAPESSGRYELAKQLVSASHPLTARVMVNRIWKQMLGQGLVASPDNLGVLGGRPSHPRLLDFLAEEFVKHDWSIKWLVREIARSTTYRLASEPSPAQRVDDPRGEFYSYRNIKRLSAEEIRDAMLQTAGSLDRRLGGESIPVYLSKQMTGRGRPKKSGPLDGGNRRTLYVEVRRNFLSPLLLAFDFPMPSTTTGRRNLSNVPAQALAMLNAPLVREMTGRWAEHIASQQWSEVVDEAAKIRGMFRDAFARPATDAEIEGCLTAINQDGMTWSDLAQVLVNSKEFIYLR